MDVVKAIVATFLVLIAAIAATVIGTFMGGVFLIIIVFVVVYGIIKAEKDLDED